MPEENNIDQQDDLKESERKSLLKMVLGMAMNRYKYDPKAKKSPAISMIANDLNLVGITLSNDTVLAYLQEAAKKIPYKRHES
jgi:hypothetical protein